MLLMLGLVTQAGAKDRQIYPDPGQAKADIAAALESAATSHKRVILDFGGNWCPDCQALYNYFHDAANQRILADNFIVVYVNIGLREKLAVSANARDVVCDANLKRDGFHATRRREHHKAFRADVVIRR